MTTYFAFSDESGQYGENASSRFCHAWPYYVRSAVLIDIESWRILKDRFFDLKGQYGLPPDKEIKWSYVWSLEKHRQRNAFIPQDKPYYFLRDVPIPKLLQFISASCKLMSECTYCKIMFTVTFNNTSCMIAEASLYKMHLQELMQRIEMEIQWNPANLAILFFDPINGKVDKLIRNAYRDIYLTGDFIKKYSHIKDSISFELSHHSFGIQMSDYAAGIFHGFLRGYEDSCKLFCNHIYGLLRRDDTSGKILGYGIREVPANPDIRSLLEGHFQAMGLAITASK